MDRLHSGWLTKAPPENRMRGPWLFKSHWRRRFFVLYVPPSSVGRTFAAASLAFLDYYDSVRTTNKKGTIELKTCEEILDHLDSPYYKYLFSLRTLKRTYYLAADSEEDMDKWVSQLSSIMGFSSHDVLPPVVPHVVTPALMMPSQTPQVPVTPSRPQRPPKPTLRLSPASTTQNDVTAVSPLPAKPPTLPPSLSKATVPGMHLNINKKELDEDCPPMLSPKQRQQALDFGCSGNGRREPEGLYKRPTMYYPSSNRDNDYDHPQPSSRLTRKSVDDSGIMDDVYKFPIALLSRDDDLSDDDYDIPPSLLRSCHGSARLTRSSSADDIYDFPTPQVQSGLPPLPHSAPKIHQYINAPSAIHEPSDTVPNACALNTAGSVKSSAMAQLYGCCDSANGHHGCLADEAECLYFMPSSRTRSFKSSRNQSQTAADDVRKKLPLTKPNVPAADLSEDDSSD